MNDYEALVTGLCIILVFVICFLMGKVQGQKERIESLNRELRAIIKFYKPKRPEQYPESEINVLSLKSMPINYIGE